MRRTCVQFVLVTLALLCAAGAFADSRYDANGESQQARVVTAGAVVRSGPSDNSYLTDALAEGSAVDVYHRRPDGWCAIRPPDGSFSWVFAQHVQLTGDGLAKINKDDVASRIGSRLSTSRDLVQVRLRKGETVRVLDKEEADSGDVWYKIAPPAGEFRWIDAKDIAPPTANDVRERRDNRVTTAALEMPINNQAADIMAPPLAGDAPTSPVSPSVQAAPVVEKSNKAPAADITPVPAEPIASAELAKQLGDLELRLSRMVAEPTATWSVEALEQSAEQLLARAESVGDRAAVKSTLEKIDRFAVIQRRYQNLNGTTTARVRSINQGQPNNAVGAMNTSGVTNSSAPGPYDAAGTLRPVVSRRPGAPQFALVNDQGQVVTFITPSPDVNLQPYVGRRVAVSGNRGYIPEFHRAHVTASRVTPLSDRIVR